MDQAVNPTDIDKSAKSSQPLNGAADYGSHFNRFQGFLFLFSFNFCHDCLAVKNQLCFVAVEFDNFKFQWLIFKNSEVLDVTGVDQGSRHETFYPGPKIKNQPGIYHLFHYTCGNRSVLVSLQQFVDPFITGQPFM